MRRTRWVAGTEGFLHAHGATRRAAHPNLQIPA